MRKIFACFLLFLATYIFPQKLFASQPPVNFSFSPATGSYPANQEQTVNLIIQTADSQNIIVGFDIYLTAQNNLNLISLGTPAVYNNPANTPFETEILKQVSPQAIHFSYLSFKANAELPNAIQIPVTFQGTTNGTGSISINQSVYQPLSGVIGNIPGNDYAFGSVGSANFTFDVSPTLPNCLLKAQGDANCDGHINGIDLGILILYQCIKTNPAQVCSDLRADFNNNGQVDAEDRQTVINNLQ